MFPLLMEKMPWPPEGAMGPIFSEYLFVRFFQRDNEKKEGIYWAEAKMDELLMQLRHYLEPDKNIVTKSKYLLFCLMSVFHVFMSVFHVYIVRFLILRCLFVARIPLCGFVTMNQSYMVSKVVTKDTVI